MTDKEKSDAAITHLKKTTVGYINKKWTIPPAGTEWKQALDILATIGETAPEPPPAGLKWARPILTDPVVCNVSATNRTFDLQGRDFVIKMPSTPVTWPYGVTIKDGGKGTVIGGEINLTTPYDGNQNFDRFYGFYVLACDHIHFERVWVHGAGVGQAINYSPLWNVSGSSTGIATHQFCRFEALHPVGPIHTDAIQSAAGPADFRMWNCSLRSNALSLQMQTRQYGYAGAIQWYLENVDMQKMSSDSWALNKTSSGKPWWPVYQKNVYMKFSTGDSNYGTNWTDGTKSGWDVGGANGGEQVTGENIKFGSVPAGGDFCPTSQCGIGYRE
jgi:hypothetical protein